MGKKKSVVLMVLLTIVIVVLCALVAFPSVPLGEINRWSPIAERYDFGADLGGGYYTYYYPQGVISETVYVENLSALEGEEADEYEDSYKKFNGLYLSTDVDDGVLNADGEVTETFKTEFEKLAKEVNNRFEKKGYSAYRVAVVDDYALRVEVPKSESQVSEVFTQLSKTGALTIEKGGELVDELKEEDVTVSDLISGFSVATKYKATYLSVKFTSKGKAMVSRVKSELSESSAGSESATTLDIKLDGATVVSIYKDAIVSGNGEARPMALDQTEGHRIETYSIMLNSVLDNEYEISFSDVSDIRTFSPIYGSAVVTLLYIALGVSLLLALVLPIVKMGRFGVVSAYGTLSYFIVAGICFKYITGGVFEFSLGTVFVFLAGLAVMNVLQMQLYGAIKKEFDLGKTVESSVKGAYKKTIWGVVDVYVVLLLAGIVLLFAGAGLFTMALQAIICIVTGAFCNLLWLRGINYTLLSASKDKFKYFRFVREDDDDDE
ncbi:MAG: hypothetical protein IJ996_00445 [Clostridia bacterium]|nr:hypothetical protein [Clostridia bacterium]